MSYLINPNKEITLTDLGNILTKFQQGELVHLKKLRRYHQGDQPILYRNSPDDTRPLINLVCNYCHTIVNNLASYTGRVQYASDSESFEEIRKVLNYNDDQEETAELLLNTLIYGVGYELSYIDSDSQIRYQVLNSEECIPVYNADLEGNLRYVIRFWCEEEVTDPLQQIYHVELYSDKSTKIYKSSMGFTSFQLIDELPNYFNQVPVSIAELNESVIEQILSLQDAYNEILSDSVSAYSDFASAYLLLKGNFADISDDDITDMKRHRCLVLPEGGDASYLVKQINSTETQTALNNINDQIYKISQTVDFSNKDLFAATTSGEALKYRMIQQEQVAYTIECAMKMCLQKRIELIASILSLTDNAEEELWRDVQITFIRNTPYDTTQAINIVNALKGIVSTRTLLSLLPFIKDPDAELEAVRQETEENYSLYNFGLTNEEN